jgi:hypothetical protein
MPILTGCCCFISLKTGSRASAWFTFIFAICNIAIDIVSLIRLHYAQAHMEPQEQYIYLPPGIVPLIYIELFSSVVMFFLGIVLFIGINYEFEGKKLIYTWMIGLIIDRCYDIFIGVYIMVWIGGHRFTDVIYVLPESIVIAVYWLLNTIIMVAAILCVMSYWQELQDVLFGKERRIKYHRKLANIRTAALSGYTTPYKSYYSSRSMLQLSQSQGSISHLPDM